MTIQVHQPVIVGVPLDDTTHDVLDAALVLARSLETSLVPVHALAPYPFPTARRTVEEGRAAAARVRDAIAGSDLRGVEVVEPIVEEASATTSILDAAERLHAQMIVVGVGRGPTVASWLLGTVADRVVRTARCPVFLARGSLPGPSRPILCPFDGSPHARLGFEAALRMARLFDAPLHVLTVVPSEPAWTTDELVRRAAELEPAAREEITTLLRGHDTRGVAWDVRVVVADPSTAILAAAESASLVVVAGRTFDLLVPASLGDVTSRVVRGSRASVLAVRDLEPDPDARRALLRRVLDFRESARAALTSSQVDRALRYLRIAEAIMPGYAPVEDDLAAVLERAGRAEEADRHRALARVLRASHT